MSSSVSLKSNRNCDRISNLPNNLITHILSFLSTKDAVKTSALSTSWNQQWTLVPVICFDGNSTYSKSFMNFFYRVLLYKVTPLDLFQFTWDSSYAIYFNDWISIALSRHVREIDIWTYRRTPLPDAVYSSKTLVVLKLRGDFVFEVPETISLDSLKIIHLNYDEYTVFEGGESFSRLISSCPVLEELQIIGELVENVKVLNISSVVLKRLIFKDLILYSDAPHKHELVLNTPNLQYLEHIDEEGLPDRYHINTLHCLDTACFSFDLSDYEFGEPIPARPLADLVLAISSVRVLSILQNSFEDLYSTALLNFELPKFDRLIYLELGYIGLDAGLRLLIGFLQSSPQLEYLSFYLDCQDEAWYPPTDVPFCMIYNIKAIKVDYRDEQEPVLSVLAYFLEKTNCLKELIILHPEKKDEEFIKKVSMLPRASNSCEISLT